MPLLTKANPQLLVCRSINHSSYCPKQNASSSSFLVGLVLHKPTRTLSWCIKSARNPESPAGLPPAALVSRAAPEAGVVGCQPSQGTARTAQTARRSHSLAVSHFPHSHTLYAQDMGFPTVASFHRNEETTLTTGNYTVSAVQGRRARTLCRSRTTQKTLLPIRKEKQSPARAAVATFIPAPRRASTQAAKPNQHRPSTKLKPFWRRRTGWDRSLLSSESRSHARFPIRLTALGTAQETPTLGLVALRVGPRYRYMCTPPASQASPSCGLRVARRQAPHGQALDFGDHLAQLGNLNLNCRMK